MKASSDRIVKLLETRSYLSDPINICWVMNRVRVSALTAEVSETPSTLTTEITRAKDKQANVETCRQLPAVALTSTLGWTVSLARHSGLWLLPEAGYVTWISWCKWERLEVNPGKDGCMSCDHSSGMKTTGHRITVTGYSSQKNTLLVYRPTADRSIHLS
jgi:hypothetical protein